MYNSVLFGCFGILVLSIIGMVSIFKDHNRNFIEFVICFFGMIISLYVAVSIIQIN